MNNKEISISILNNIDSFYNLIKIVNKDRYKIDKSLTEKQFFALSELSGEPPQAMITCYGESGKEIYTVKFYDGFMMVDNELYRITGKVYKELAELCDKYGECQIN